MVDIKEVLDERCSRYGSFGTSASIAQDLKMVITKSRYSNWEKIPVTQKEALDLICTKISRILNGDYTYKDNWVDIAGYAKLVADVLEDEKENDQ